ncbi:MAG: amino acid permease [Candidatus Omnitrophica bacterium]|jgi:amino acid transporter|nr:amino acid permease [Candidatus Omnitrophota bacterium]
MQPIVKKFERPRELKWFQAGAMLYGDWGTSKAYVIGIAFALAGHASWFYLGMMAILTMVVGFCYSIICRLYPDGGGVYSSLRSRSKMMASIGGFMLVADYVVTASLSALSAFHYFGVGNPALWAIGAILLIGILNWVGPAGGSNIAVGVGLIASLFAGILFLFTLPHVADVRLTWPTGPLHEHWAVFAGIVLALSGVEAIANMTGVMVEPVQKTARKAIFPVMCEVALLTFLLGVAVNGLPGDPSEHIEDMLRVLGGHYVSPWFGQAIALVFACLLLSAVNTAINAFTSIQFVMAKDRQLPSFYTRLNRFGMPWIALLAAAAVPASVLLFVHDLVTLASLYAIGVVGAITINLGACSLNRALKLKTWERALLFVVSLILLMIWLTIATHKIKALFFAVIVVGVGLLLRMLAKSVLPAPEPTAVPSSEVLTVSEAKDIGPLYRSSFMLALKRVTPTMIENAALQVKARNENAIYFCHVEEIPLNADLPSEITPAPDSLELLAAVEHQFAERDITLIPVWQAGQQAGRQLAYVANQLGVKTVLIGTTEHTALMNLVRGDVMRTLAQHLNKNCNLMILS